MLADPCADPGIFARVVQARLPENSSDNGFCLFFCPQLLQWLFNGLFQKKTIILQGFGGGGGVVQPISGGGGGWGRGLGVQILILETHRTLYCNFVCCIVDCCTYRGNYLKQRSKPLLICRSLEGTIP